MIQIINNPEISTQHNLTWYQLCGLLGYNSSFQPVQGDAIRTIGSDLGGVLRNSSHSCLGVFQVSGSDDGFEARVHYSYELMRFSSLVPTISWQLIPSLTDINREEGDLRMVPTGGYQRHILRHEIAHALHWKALVESYLEEGQDDFSARKSAFNTFFPKKNLGWVEGMAEMISMYSAFHGNNGQERLFSVLMLGRHLGLMPNDYRVFLEDHGLPFGIEEQIESRERVIIGEVVDRIKTVEREVSGLVKGSSSWERYKRERMPYASGLGKMMIARKMFPDLSFNDLFRNPFSDGSSVTNYIKQFQPSN
ncbi:MAG: hypothetical protein ABIH82_04285 [Candidatus Woesearchaeota archaeon]